MYLSCQLEIDPLRSNWLPDTLLLLLKRNKQLMGIGFGDGFKVSHNGGGKKWIEDRNKSDGIQLREKDRQSVPQCVRRDN
jgi:hypothetical protein